MSKPESLKRPNHGTTTELRNGVITETVVNPDGTQTVRTVPVEKPKPNP